MCIDECASIRFSSVLSIQCSTLWVRISYMWRRRRQINRLFSYFWNLKTLTLLFVYINMWNHWKNIVRYKCDKRAQCPSLFFRVVYTKHIFQNSLDDRCWLLFGTQFPSFVYTHFFSMGNLNERMTCIHKVLALFFVSLFLSFSSTFTSFAVCIWNVLR